MSLTNSAFVKAYGQESALSPEPAATASAAPPSQEKSPQETRPIGAGKAAPSVPDPHFEVSDRTGQDDASARGEESTEQVVALPLSSYIGLSSANSGSGTATPQALPAGQHVDGFVWPEVCQTISRAAGEEINAIARSVLQASARGEKMIAVTGCRRGEGRTTLLQCIAQALRSSDVSVALIDADVHRPALAERLGVQPEIGWDDVLLRARQLPEALVSSESERITLLPRRQPLSGEDEPLQRTRQEVIFRMIRDQCDIVLIDTGPLLEDLECGVGWLAECDLIDAAIVVCDPHRNCQRRLSRVFEALRQREILPAGVVENFVENFAAVAASTGRHLRRDAPSE